MNTTITHNQSLLGAYATNMGTNVSTGIQPPSLNYSSLLTGTRESGLTGTRESSYPATSYIQTTALNTFAPVSGNDNSKSTIQKQNQMAPKQVNVAVFTITRDKDTNEVNSTKFIKELWIEQKNGTSIDLIVAKQLGADFDPELTVIKTLTTVNF